MALTLADKYIRRGQHLLRVAEGEANDAALLLDKTTRRISRILKADYSEKITKRQLIRIEKRIDEELTRYYGETLPAEIRSGAIAAVSSEVSFNVATITGETAQQLLVPKNRAIVKRTARKTYQGKRISTWVSREFAHNSNKINGILRKGFVDSKTLSEIEGEISVLTGRSRRDVRTIVRGSFTQNATEARQTVYGLNPDVVEGAIWVSVLDNRTTADICGARDGFSYDNERNPTDGGLPWLEGPGLIHWLCRSLDIPKLIGVDRKGNRSSVDAGYAYERGDNKNPRGSVKKPIKKNREDGTFKISRHTTQTRYEGWLRTQSRKNIDYASDILGSKKLAREFRDGKVTLQQLGLESPVARPINRSSL